MGDFAFKWAHPNANEVYVTGTFDSWSKSEKLEKKGDIFEKTVTLPDASKKIYYKFVVDGNWVTDETAPQENDHEGNLNNVLTPERITKAPVIMSGVAPTSTTAALAKDVPLEKTGSTDLPGTFPETPATEPAAFSVAPIPATEGVGNPIHLAPGEQVPDPSTLTKNTISSTVQDDAGLKAANLDQKISVAPIPASGGAGNPISLAPGEKVPEPSTITGNTIQSNVHLDKESYEKGDSTVPVLLPVAGSAVSAEKGVGALDLPPMTNKMIPESSLPMGGSGAGTFDANPTIQSAGPQSTTSMLAAAVPLESEKVPDVVTESQKEAGVSPEASAEPEEVKDKAAVEQELLGQVKPAAVTSDDTHHENTTATTAAEAAGAVGAAALAIGGAALAYATGAKDKVVSATGLGGAATTTTEKVPEVVKDSIAESGAPPEAAAFADEVKEKSAVEKELLSKVKPEESTGEPAPSATLDAPFQAHPVDSRDVSPTTVPGGRKPLVDTPAAAVPAVAAATTSTPSKPAAPATAATPAAPDTPAKASGSTPASPADVSSAAADKKKKRSSFFGKLKSKLLDKDKSK